MRSLMLEADTRRGQDDWLNRLLDRRHGGAWYASGQPAMMHGTPCLFTARDAHVADAHLFMSNAATGPAKPSLLNSDQLMAIIMEHSTQAQRIRAAEVEDENARLRLQLAQVQEALAMQSSLVTVMARTVSRHAASPANERAIGHSEGDAVVFGKPKRKSSIQVEFRGRRRGRPLVVPENFVE